MDISKELFNVEIRERSVEIFYQEANGLIHNAGKDWGPEAVTRIISSRVTEKPIFDKVNTFFKDHAGVGLKALSSTLSLSCTNSSLEDQTLDDSTRWLITQAWRAFGDLMGNNKMQTYADEIRNRSRPNLEAPFPKLEHFSLRQSTTPDAVGISLSALYAWHVK